MTNDEKQKLWDSFLEFFNGSVPDPDHEPIRFEYYLKLFKYYKHNA